MESKDQIEESKRLLELSRELVGDIEHVLDELASRSTIMRYKRLLERMRADNERLYRENKLLRYRLGEDI